MKSLIPKAVAQRQELVEKNGNKRSGTDLLLNLGVFLLGVDQIKDDVECSREDEGEEETESSQISIPLRTNKGHTSIKPRRTIRTQRRRTRIYERQSWFPNGHHELLDQTSSPTLLPQ